jgi:hypothetical protein
LLAAANLQPCDQCGEPEPEATAIIELPSALRPLAAVEPVSGN